MIACRFCGEPTEEREDDEGLCPVCIALYLTPDESLDRETDRAWAVARALTFPELAIRKRGTR